MLDDCYFPHSYEEIEELVSPPVAAALNKSKSYGVSCYNRRRVKTRQVAEDDIDGRRYRQVQRTVWRPKEEWVGIPVPDAGIPREMVDAAREAVKYNRASQRGKRFFELSGGVFFLRRIRAPDDSQP